ncbi:hypothetical protein [Pelomonas aquatica]|uniref:Uncharacterized protein n=1 Tax=Pelomonas aquatica TaxID=431058 RepID=A0A9X4R328_9BURK|nr:hypothetical protein [Pelomonas aquatica]MDG0861612.1 hypothetical protein [Pelomonas aquatica]
MKSRDFRTQTNAPVLALSLSVAQTLARATEAENPADIALPAEAEAVAGRQPGHSFDARAFTASNEWPKTETLTFAPGKGAEVKAALTEGRPQSSGGRPVRKYSLT